ncbi:MAG: hypothetical protein IPK60_23755 [Sandaracinaceae bacterium]|nr:hypothetical protein [Sandaracinaceae bacterium]
MFTKILLASRGEIAARVARTCKRMSITTVAVHGDADSDSIHVQASDEVIAISTEAGVASYMTHDAMIDAAKKSGADAVHPGYGMLATDVEFAKRVVVEGLSWVGPSAEMLALCADDSAVRAAAAETSVRMAPPKGEEPIPFPRHIEVQLIGDAAFDFVTIGERECSLRHHKKRLLAESPAPGVSALLNGDYVREALNEAAIRLASTLKLVGPVTVKFLLDPDGVYHCLGVTPGLTPEHALHEMCTGLDLVEVQMRLAAGEAMPDEVLVATPTGHAIEARVAWDDAEPATGVVEEARFPPIGAGKVRIETGFAPGTRILDSYDDIVANVTAYTPARHQSVLTLDRVIAETAMSPQKTNIPLLRKVLGHEGFRAGQFDATFVERMLTQRL